MVLNTGRLRDQWHTMTRTGTSPRLFGHTDVPAVHMSRADADRLGISEGVLLEVRNDLGLIRGIAAPEDAVAAGQLFYPMHWNARFAHPARVGTLIRPVTDPISGQPESKHAAVRVEPCNVGQWVRLACREPLDESVLAADVLLWTRLPAEAGTLSYELALGPGASPQQIAARLRRGVRHDNAVTFTDVGRGRLRLLLERSEPEQAVLVAFTAQSRDELPARGRLAEALDGTLDPRRRLASPAAGSTARTVCTCFQVSESAILDAIASGAHSTEALGRRLSCGTNCGSCLPELKSLIAGNATAAAS